ncbi:PEP-CTERM sorting domain-containing protein [Gemmatimonas sp.]|uniref:PEP-CTERM sorting domain-containing protein n=1 Tax=Gemmatimonas sp. TaxID=1962908 RepID=UPI003565EEF2
MSALLCAETAKAQLTNYTIQGVFTDASSGDEALQSAINPVLGANTFFSVLLSIDTPATGGTAFIEGGEPEPCKRLFPARRRRLVPSSVLEVRDARALSFQFSFFLADFFANTLTSESAIPDLRSLALSGNFAVFAPPANPIPQPFDRANFGLRVTSITLQQVVPEPSTYMLLAAGLAGLGVISRRRRHQWAID